MPDLPDRDEARFAEIRDRLDGVNRHEPEPEGLESAPGPLDPMLATAYDGELEDLDLGRWVAEQKFDGTRLLLQQFDGEVTLYTRRHVERSDTLPRLVEIAGQTVPDGVILDGEYTFLDPGGDSQFVPITAGDDRIASRQLTPQYLVFDVLAVDHEWCLRQPLEERKEILDNLLPDSGMLRTVETEGSDIPAFYDDIVGRGEEGIILKRVGSPYHLATRSDHWRKVKATTERDFVAVGYTPGLGRRASTFGALVLTDGTDYVGRVGSGFTEDELASITSEFEPIEERPVSVASVGSEYTPIEPFVVQVEYLEITPSGDLRAPVFRRTRPDKPIDDVQPV